MVVLCLVFGSSVKSNKGLGFESRLQGKFNWCLGLLITSNMFKFIASIYIYIYIYKSFMLCYFLFMSWYEAFAFHYHLDFNCTIHIL